MINAIIIDDEKRNIENLKAMLAKHCKEVEVIGEARSGSEGLKLLASQKPDLIFLDIKMPNMTGFEMLTSLEDRDFEVIFVTGFDEYGIDAIKFSALDYLLKPVREEDLKRAVAKALNRIGRNQPNQNIANLLEILNNPDSPFHRMAIETPKETILVHPSEIIKIESKNSYSLIYLNNPKMEILVSNPIYEYEKLLDKFQFVRLHRSWLVNRRYISSIPKADNQSFVTLLDLTFVPVGRTKKSRLKDMLINIK